MSKRIENYKQHLKQYASTKGSVRSKRNNSKERDSSRISSRNYTAEKKSPKRKKKKAKTVIKIVENNNDDYLEEYISDGNTGATKEGYKVTKRQLRDQAKKIEKKLKDKSFKQPILDIYTPNQLATLNILQKNIVAKRAKNIPS